MSLFKEKSQRSVSQEHGKVVRTGFCVAVFLAYFGCCFYAHQSKPPENNSILRNVISVRATIHNHKAIYDAN